MALTANRYPSTIPSLMATVLLPAPSRRKTRNLPNRKPSALFPARGPRLRRSPSPRSRKSQEEDVLSWAAPIKRRILPWGYQPKASTSPSFPSSSTTSRPTSWISALANGASLQESTGNSSTNIPSTCSTRCFTTGRTTRRSEDWSAARASWPMRNSGKRAISTSIRASITGRWITTKGRFRYSGGFSIMKLSMSPASQNSQSQSRAWTRSRKQAPRLRSHWARSQKTRLTLSES